MKSRLNRRTRRRARNTTQEKCSESLSKDKLSYKSYVLRNYSTSKLVNAASLVASTKTPIHPLNGILGSSPQVEWGLGAGLFGANTTVGKQFSIGVLRKVKLRLTFVNLEAFSVRVNIGYLGSQAYAGFTNNAQGDHTLLCEKTIHLQKAGSTYDTLTFDLEFVIPDKEGNLSWDSYRSNNDYWATSTSGPALGYGYYVEYFDDAALTNSTTGVQCIAVCDFEYNLLARNNNLQL